MDKKRHLIKENFDNIELFDELYFEYKKNVFAVAFSILKDSKLAEDILQEVFIKLFLQMKKSDISNISAWLISVARNGALDYIRKNHFETSDIDNYFFYNEQAFSQDPLEKMVLAKYFEVLDRDERQIIVLKAISGYKHREIAKIIGLPIGTVTWKYKVALKKLRNSMDFRYSTPIISKKYKERNYVEK